MKRNRSTDPTANLCRFRPTAKRGRPIAAVMLAFAAFATLSNAQQPAANQPPQYIERSYPDTPGNRLPSKNAQMSMQEKSARKKNLEAANLERKRQIDSDSAQLVALARELKSAVDKSGKEALSPKAARKAELIEKLAHAIEEKMKLTVDGS